MRLFKLPLAGALALSVLGLSASALAQSDGKADPGYVYEFMDDDLVGDTLGTTSALIRVRPGAAKTTLIRPRASFVPELLKSVELM